MNMLKEWALLGTIIDIMLLFYVFIYTTLGAQLNIVFDI